MPQPDIHARAVRFEFEELDRHWMGGDPVATHILNGLQLTLPALELFMVRSVAAVMPTIDDERLRTEAEGFARQEGSHAREHRRYLRWMANRGYRFERQLAWQDTLLRGLDRYTPVSLRLAICAGMEHYTALLGHDILAIRPFDAASPQMRALIQWHAAEEIEHKAVVFDLLEQTNPSYLLRVLGLLIGTALMVGLGGAGTVSLLAQEVRAGGFRALKAPPRESGPPLSPPLLPLVAQALRYLKPGFHPWDDDDLALAESYFASDEGAALACA